MQEPQPRELVLREMLSAPPALVALAHGNSAVSCAMGQQRQKSGDSQGWQSVSLGLTSREEGTPNSLGYFGLCEDQKSSPGCGGC